MVAQVKTWGNGQGVRFSKELLETLDIHLNEYLNVDVIDGNIVLSKTFKHKTLEERAKERGEEFEPLEEVDWGEPTGREVW